MARKAKAKKVEEAPKALTAEELKEVREAQGKLNQAIFDLGALELTRQNLIAQHTLVKGEWDTKVQELEAKYGRVNVNLDNGEIAPAEEEEAK